MVHRVDPNSALSQDARLRYPFIRDMETTPPPVPSSVPPIPEPKPVATVAKWRWWLFLVIIGPYPTLIGIVLPWFKETYWPSAKSEGPALGTTTSELAVQATLALLSFAVPLGIAWLIARPTISELGMNRSRSRDWPTWAWLLLAALFTAGWMFIYVVLKLQDLKPGQDPIAFLKPLLTGTVFAWLFVPPAVAIPVLFLVRRFLPPWIATPTCQGAVYSVLLRLGAGVAILAVILIVSVVKGIPLDGMMKQVQENQPKVENLVSKDALENNWAYLLLGMTLVSFVMAGWREELWRSATMLAMEKLFPSLRYFRMGQALLIFLPALIFAFGHFGQGIGGIILTGLIGIGCGALILFQKNIWTAVMAHGFIDATSFAMLPFALDLIKKAQQAAGH